MQEPRFWPHFLWSNHNRSFHEWWTQWSTRLVQELRRSWILARDSTVELRSHQSRTEIQSKLSSLLHRQSTSPDCTMRRHSKSPRWRSLGSLLQSHTWCFFCMLPFVHFLSTLWLISFFSSFIQRVVNDRPFQRLLPSSLDLHLFEYHPWRDLHHLWLSNFTF